MQREVLDDYADPNIWTRVPYVNFGLATSRSKSDCTRDVSVSRTGLRTRSEKKEESGFEDWQLRLKNSFKIYQKYVAGLTGSILDSAVSLWRKHWNYFRQKLPGLPLPGFFDNRVFEMMRLFSETVLRQIFRDTSHRDPAVALSGVLGYCDSLSTLSSDYDPFVEFNRIVRSGGKGGWERKVWAAV